MPSNIYIIEKLPNPVPKFDGLVISLAPEVSYQLSKIGVVYSIPEDFLSMQELYSKTPEYTRLFDEWLNGLDESLMQYFKNFKLLNVNPARLYGYWLGWIIGSYVTNSLFIKAILENTGPSKVIYYRSESRYKPTGIEIWNETGTISSILIPHICKNKNIDLQEVLVKDVKNKKNIKFKSKLSFLKYSLYKIYKTMKLFPNNLIGFILKKPAILSLYYSGWGIDEILHSAGRAGYQLRYMSKILFTEPVVPEMDLINKIDLNLKLYNDFIGFDLSEVLKERIRYFIEIIAPKLEIAVPKYQELFIKKRISIVLGYSKSTFIEHSIIAAAVASKSTLAVQFTHGYDSFDSHFKHSLSEGPCDLYMTFGEELKKYFSASVFQKSEVFVEEAPLWVKKYTNIRGSRKTAGPHKKPLVLYIPAIMFSDLMRPDEFYYSSCWYFEHQMKLLKYFDTEKAFDFIWKGLPQSEGTRNPIPDVIEKNGYANIKFSSGKLVDYIISADYAIMDYPSSYMFEVVSSGLPALSLYHESFMIRDSAKALFGSILEQFFTTEEAIRCIGKFLRSNPDNYLVNIDVSEDKSFEIIERYAKNKCHAK